MVDIDTVAASLCRSVARCGTELLERSERIPEVPPLDDPSVDKNDTSSTGPRDTRRYRLTCLHERRHDAEFALCIQRGQ